jgi:S-adenosylmethionine synthetase
MKDRKYLFTSESVSEGHPDKLCDQISDAILDEVLRQDPMSRVACETFVTTGTVIVGGEITTKAHIDIDPLIRKVINEVGYNDSALGFDCHSCGIMSLIQKQSPDIAMGVDVGGAGDQGMMFGYATNETKEFMPLPISLAHKLVKELTRLRNKKVLKYLRPDSKSQVTVQYEKGRPVRVDTIVVSTQHDPHVSMKKVAADMKNILIKKVIPARFLDKKTKIFVNPTGRFEIGGPHGDTGLTGRKIIVDTYGGMGAHGGGAFSGKDPTKVDRSASYFARYVAKNVVASGMADRCEVQVAYAIGVAQPVSVLVNTHHTGKVSDEKIEQAVKRLFDFRPQAIIKKLDLRRPIYRNTAAYGHFGRVNEGFVWERTDMAARLKRELSR